MTTARPVLPTDLVAFVAPPARGLRNEAWTRERLGAEDVVHPLGTALDQILAFARGRSAWISARRGRLQGLVSVRRRGGRQAWEIDYLIDATAEHDVVLGLLDGATAEVGRDSGEKLFLRLAAESELLDSVCNAGFVGYDRQLLYRRGHGPPPAREEVGLRPVTPADAYNLYRLYNAALPESVRRFEAATFTEWHAAREQRWLRGGGIELLSESAGAVEALVRVAKLPQGTSLDLLVSEEGAKHVDAIVAGAVRTIGGIDAPLYVVAPAAGSGIGGELEACGFEVAREFVCLVRRTTRPLAMPAKLRTAIAKNPIGV